MMGWLRKGVGELVRQAGLQLMDLLMEEEVRELAGERSQRQPERTVSRWGRERGYCVVMGQKVPVQRPRVRTTDDKEVRLGSYELFHRGEPGKVEDHDGAPVGQDAPLRVADRRHAICRTADGSRVGHR